MFRLYVASDHRHDVNAPVGVGVQIVHARVNHEVIRRHGVKTDDFAIKIPDHFELRPARHAHRVDAGQDFALEIGLLLQAIVKPRADRARRVAWLRSKRRKRGKLVAAE